ncbi:hypothetical protein CRM22_003665 [Opisthorchis felineus]|uniref:Uncharacterized protein n=1 Tax=Opisthorchis felineus TaxID=147828 RepID=A0A4S2M581_OPIFE|nr:hypothetical protein CRM22_003665 [Opisthorchis felineus]TGZ69580.1 hypothetical protein CRM22_003665 [Opisthorchis felineus]
MDCYLLAWTVLAFLSDTAFSKTYSCTNTTNKIVISVIDRAIECTRNEVPTRSALKGTLASLNFVSSIRPLTLDSESTSIRFPNLNVGELYSVTCSNEVRTVKSDTTTCFVTISDSSPTAKLANFRVCPEGTAVGEVKFCWEVSSPITTVDVFYRELTIGRNCILPYDSADRGKKTTTVSVSSLSPASVTLVGTKVQAWLSSVRDARAPPIVAGAVKVEQPDIQLKNIVKEGKTVRISLSEALWNPFNTPKMLAVVHDGCGACTGLVQPECSGCRTPMQLSASTDTKVLELCGRGTPKKLTITRSNIPSDTLELEITEDIQLEENVLTVLADRPLSSPLPKVTSTAASFTVKIPAIATEASVAVWSGFSKVEIYRPLTHHVTLLREKCATYGVQLQLKPVTAGAPSSLLEVAPDDTSRPGRPRSLTTVPVGNHLLKVTWAEPMTQITCPHKYVVKQLTSRGIETAVVHIPATDPLEHTFFQGCEDHTYSVYAVLEGSKLQGISSEIAAVGKGMKRVTNLQATVIDSENVRLTWTVENEQCPTTQLFIEARPTEGELITHMVADTLRETTLSLPTCHPYEIVITSGIQHAQRSNPVVVRTRTKRPPAPQNLMAENISPKHQKVKWMAPSVEVLCFHTYSVKQLLEGRQVAELTIQPLPRQISFEAIFEVTPGCKTYSYEVRIRASPDNVEGPQVTVEKKTITSPIQPERLTVSSTGVPAEVMVSWEYNSQCNPTGYDVKVYGDSGRIFRTVQSTDKEIRIGRLPTCAHLLVGVRTRVDNISGPESELKEFVLNEQLIFNTHPGCDTYAYEVVPIEESTGKTTGTPASLTRKSQPPKLQAPTEVKVEQQQEGLVKISWKKVDHERGCGDFAYAVYANKTMGTDYTRVPATAVQTEKVVQLEQCTDYIVYVESIRTMDNITERVQSDAVRLRTKVEKPAPVVSLAVTENKATSQKLTWAAPTNQLKCAWYELVKVKASNSGHLVVVRLDLVDTSYEFQHLTPGTTYKYKIRVVADGIAGDYSQEVVQATHTSAEDVIEDEGNSPLVVISSVDLRTVSVKLQLSSVNLVKAVHAVTLLVEPLLGPSQQAAQAYNNPAFPESLNEAWNRKISSGKGPWEVLVWQQRIQSGAGNSHILEKHNFTDILFQLGQYGIGCDKSLPCTNIPLLPGTRYSVQLKVYTSENIVESPPRLVTTRTDLSALFSLFVYIVLISLLGIGLLVAENAGFHIFPFSGPSAVELEKFKNASNLEMSVGPSSYDRPTAADAIAQDETEQFAEISDTKQPGATRPTSVGIDELSSYLQECLQPHNSFLVDQFNSLRKTDVDSGAQHGLSTSIAMQPENCELNRSMDALPYDQNLVLVQGDASSPEEGRYINASYIFDIAPSSEQSEPPAVDLNCTPYIATQAPSPGTAGDFWQMVFEQKVNSIVQLAPSLGEFIPNFEAYWPTNFDDAKTCESGTVELQINLVSESAHSGYMRRKLSVTSSVDPDNPHEVTQFQLLNWSEQGVPDSQEFRFMLTAYRVFKFTETTLNSPTVVHCNNGVGRTGTFIAADIIKNHLEEGAEFIDIAGIVEQLRQCRMNMVQKNTQYVFLHMFTKTAVE